MQKSTDELGYKVFQQLVGIIGRGIMYEVSVPGVKIYTGAF